MKKVIFISILLLSVLACKEKSESRETTQKAAVQTDPAPDEILDRKFEDKDGCSYYANLFEAIPHLDTYKEMGFGKLECLINKETTGMPPNIKAQYYDKNTNDNVEIQLFEISGEFAKEELNNVNMAKTSYNEITKIAGANTFKSSLTVFDNASVKIENAKSTDEKSTAVYLATYKDKYSIWANIEMTGKIDLAKVEVFIKEYLEGINKEALK
jgi:hypothetical protein